FSVVNSSTVFLIFGPSSLILRGTWTLHVLSLIKRLISPIIVGIAKDSNDFPKLTSNLLTAASKPIIPIWTKSSWILEFREYLRAKDSTRFLYFKTTFS